MKSFPMKIETYEQTETTSEAQTMAHDHEGLELIQRLGLVGQQKLSVPETGTRCPYRQMTSDENFVFGVMCPKRAAPENYAAGPIPLRVLQIIAWAKDNPVFKRLEIWYADSATLKDPVLVGYVAGTQYAWEEDIFLLARWADELLPVEVLMPDAYKVWWRNKASALRRTQAETATQIASHESMKDTVHVPEKP
jgi:hypothetical protein